MKKRRAAPAKGGPSQPSIGAEKPSSARCRCSLVVVAALEALDAGDFRLCEQILLGAREDGPTERGCVCPACGLAFRWPGERDAHVERVHGFAEEEAA